MLTAANLGKRFDRRWILRGVELSLVQGDRLLITGRNGAGKSTLLKLLAGLVAPSEGTVRRAGTLGLAALDGRLYPALTAREHWAFAAEVRGLDGDLPDRFGLKDALDEPAAALSSGQRSRLRLALAVGHAPDVLLLDEPGASLDAAGRELVEGIVAEQSARGVLVLATNDPSERRYGTAELELE